jgi:3-oxoacyl-[acyl-carrier protein] reductase
MVSTSRLSRAVSYLASRTASSSVTVNAVAPALIAPTGMLPGDPDQLATRIPVGRLGTTAEVAKLTVAVLQNDYITNQVIGIDGGIHPRC